MRLPKFCFHCGVIRHGKGGCFSLQNRSKPRKEMDYPYGQWLRVSFPVRKGNSVEPQWRKREDSGKKVGQGDGTQSCYSEENDIWKMDGNAGGGGCSSSHGVLSTGDISSKSKELKLVDQRHGVDLLRPEESTAPGRLRESKEEGHISR
jgi:hypothetical protein